MKFLYYGFCLLLIGSLLSACAVTKQGRSLKKGINGNWILQTINTEGIDGKFAARVFNEADMNCFIGSNWSFVSNNSSGSYNLVGGTKGCSTLQRNIRWSIFEEQGAPKEFQFKRLDEKNNSLDDNSGFRLGLTMVDDNSMQLKSPISFEGKPGNIIYNFVKKIN